jgi:peptidoglycan/LPS O-acetylase OafA/YrhL
MCMVWGWYIQIDMQLFVVSLMLLWLYAEVNKKVFAGVTVATMIGTIVYCFVRCQTRDYHVIGNLDGANNPNSDKYYLDLYNKPWSRTGPYFLGLCVGIYYYNYTERKHAKEAPDRLETAMRCRLVRWFCFVAGLALVCVITYAPRSLLHQIQWTQFENSLYLSMGRISYSFGVCLMTLPMLLGYSNPLQTFLEWDILQFMSKLAFSCYLIHYAILTGFILDVRTSQYVNPQLILINGIAHLGPILVAGLILSLAVELPLGAICDSLLGRKRTSSHKKQRSD